MTKFEEFEEDFKNALPPGAKCVKIEIHFMYPDGDHVKVGVLREGCEDPEPDQDEDWEEE